MEKETEEIRLCFTGKTLNFRDSRWLPVIRRHYLFHFVTRGEGSFITPAGEYNLKNGDGIFVFPGRKTVYRSSPDNPWSYLWLGFNGTMASEYLDLSGITEKKPVFHTEDTDCVINNLENIFPFQNDTLRHNSWFEYKSVLYNFFSTVKNQNCTAEAFVSEDPSDPVRYAVDLMYKDYPAEVKIEDIARKCGLSRSRFFQLFKDSTGYSPKEFLTMIRMENAAALLRNTAMRVNEVAYAVGFRDPLFFTKAFNKQYGLCPSEFRERQKTDIVFS